MFAANTDIKEVTSWDGVPRDMWVWDNDDMSDKKVMTVVFMDPDTDKGFGRVLAVVEQDNDNAYKSEWFQHCGELNTVAEEDDKEDVKEVTAWDNRPRYMWVWDNANRSDMEKAFVFFRMPEYVNAVFPVYARTEDGTGYDRFKHCADILQKPDKLAHRLTYRELALWLSEKPDREWKYNDSTTVRGFFSYEEGEEDKPVPYTIYVREGDSNWRMPVKE